MGNNEGRKENRLIFWNKISSPLGNIFVGWNKKGVVIVNWLNLKKNLSLLQNNGYKPINLMESIVIEQLNEYFEGKRRKFKLKLDLHGSSFELKVWKEILNIPYGKTRSYGEIAKIIGKRNYARAVGSACRKNKICIIIPCHRVIGYNDRLVGYSGGIKRKLWLLEHEAKFANGKGKKY
ncbi:MAG: methylated-DNA--[protein]-cysteine S-methyltransferase [Candidatus Thermoplasmatota archaeon]